jgi:hypothetical protein
VRASIALTSKTGRDWRRAQVDRIVCGMRASRRLSPRPVALAVLAASLGPACAEESAAPPRLELVARAGEPPDTECLRDLQAQSVPFLAAPPTRGIRTPVQIVGPVGGVELKPRAGRPPLMDCELARALAEGAPIIRAAGIDQLYFSGAYDYRTRRRSTQMSAHAFGLAIDVHSMAGPAGSFDVKRDFQMGSGRWRGLSLREGDLAGCVGRPDSAAARRLRQLACRLKHHSAFRVVMTPDDDADHRDHLHLETFPDSAARVARVLGPL